MDWKECFDKKLVKEAKLDEPLISNLVKSSFKKMESQKRLPLDETTASSKVSIAYESARQLLESLALKNMYKVYNH